MLAVASTDNDIKSKDQKMGRYDEYKAHQKDPKNEGKPFMEQVLSEIGAAAPEKPAAAKKQ